MQTVTSWTLSSQYLYKYLAYPWSGEVRRWDMRISMLCTLLLDEFIIITYASEAV